MNSRAMGRAAVWMAVLGTLGCVEGPQTPILAGADRGLPVDVDGTTGTVGDATGGPNGQVDAVAQDAEVNVDVEVSADAGAPGEAGTDGADGGPSADAQTDGDISSPVDAGAAGEPPPPNQIAWVTSGNTSYVAWFADGAIKLARLAPNDSLCGHDDDPLWCDSAVDVLAEYPDQPSGPARIAAIEADGAPWFGFDGPDGAIQVVAVDIPGLVAPITLGLSGPPLLAVVGRRLLAIEASPTTPPEGVRPHARWQFAGYGDTTETVGPPMEEQSLPAPNSAVGVAGAALLRIGEAGQCAYIDSSGEAVGAVYCKEGQGRLISDGRSALVAYVSRDLGTGIDRLRVVPVFGMSRSQPFTIGRVTNSRGLSFSGNGATWPMMTEIQRSNDPNAGLDELSMVSADALWSSVEPYDLWRHPDVGAFVHQDEIAYALTFPDARTPRATPIQMAERVWSCEGGAAYCFDVEAGCEPHLETCDGVDEDCDGATDNGRCCAIAMAQGSWPLPLSADPVDMLVADVRGRDGFHLAVKLENDSWQAFKVMFTGRNLGPFSRDEFADFDAFNDTSGIEGRAFVNAGGYNMLFGIGPEGPVVVGHYYSAANTYYPTLRHPIPGCEDILAVDVLDLNGPRESALVVCPNRLVRVYARRQYRVEDNDEIDENDTYVVLEDISHDVSSDEPEIQARWATISRSIQPDHDFPIVLDVLASYESSIGAARFWYWQMSGPSFTDEVRPVRGNVPPGLDLIGEASGDGPIWIRALAPSRPQILDGQRPRVWFDNGEFREVVVPGRFIRSENAPQQQRLIIETAPNDDQGDDAHGFYVVDYRRTRAAGGESVLNLWATVPAFTWDPSQPYLWRAHRGQVGPDVVILHREGEGDEAHWWVTLKRIECKVP